MTKQEIKENLSTIVTQQILKDLSEQPIEAWVRKVFYNPPAKYTYSPYKSFDYEIYLSDCDNEIRIRPHIRLEKLDMEKIKNIVFDYMIEEQEKLNTALNKRHNNQIFSEIVEAFNIEVD